MKKIVCYLLGLFFLQPVFSQPAKSPVDYVNPYIGNISHLLVPTFPTVHLPNSMLRVYPERADYTSDQIKGLPLIVTSHRGRSAFNLSPVQSPGTALKPVHQFSYDNEKISPYSYQVTLDENRTLVQYAPSHQSALYSIQFTQNMPAYLIFNTINGKIRIDGNKVYASQKLDNRTVVYLFAETDVKPQTAGKLLPDGSVDVKSSGGEGNNVAVVLGFEDKEQTVHVRYGVSFISEAQAERNLRREIRDYNLKALKDRGRAQWNHVLGRIRVEGIDEADKSVFYTSLYR